MAGDDPDIDRLFSDAMQVRDDGDLLRAIQMCFDLLTRIPPSERRFLAITHTQIGYMYWLLKEFDKAEDHGRASTHYAPSSELASLLVFHVLIGRNRWREAMEEVVRYLKRKNSPEYRELVANKRFGEEFDHPTRLLLKEVRRLLLRHLRIN